MKTHTDTVIMKLRTAEMEEKEKRKTNSSHMRRGIQRASVSGVERGREKDQTEGEKDWTDNDWVGGGYTGRERK